MSLNFREIALLLSELPLVGSVIQGVTEHDFHSLTFSLFHKQEKAWLLYVEIGSENARFCRTGRMRKKAEKLQRLGQYMRSHIVGCRIENVTQIPGERLFCLSLVHGEEQSCLYFRFYSGAMANIIITDQNNSIKELMMRRPQRGEAQGLPFILPPKREVPDDAYPVRPYQGDSFNAFIEDHYKEQERTEGVAELTKRLQDKRDKEIGALRSSRSGLLRKQQENAAYEAFKQSADLLSSSSYLLKRGMESITLDDYHGGTVTVLLDPLKSPSENVESYYTKYQKSKNALKAATEELEHLDARIKEREAHYDAILSGEGPDDLIRRISKELNNQIKEKQEKQESVLGLRIESHGFDIIVGRNAKENDKILRTLTRGSDMWMHTRDWAGGYVIIKAKKDKSIPLDVLLDAGNLAVHFSKGKENRKVDLYYTECKYLRRAKGGKTGLVLPTQEKNLTITLDEERVKRLLS